MLGEPDGSEAGPAGVPPTARRPQRSTAAPRHSYVEIDHSDSDGEQETLQDTDNMLHFVVRGNTTFNERDFIDITADSQLDEALDAAKTATAARAKGEL